MVVIEADADVAASSLEVVLGWRTHGKGNVDRAESSTLNLWGGGRALRASIPERVPFDFTLPNGPASYHGHFVNVDWYVSAQLGIAWAKDPRAEEDVLVVPSGDAPYRPGTPELVAEVSREAEHVVRPKFVGALIFAAALLALGGGLLWFSRQVEDSFSMIVGGAICAVLGAVAFFGTLKRMAARSVLGDVGVLLQPATVAPGESTEVLVHLSPGRELSLDRIEATLTATESAVQGSGTSKTTHTQVVFEKKLEVSGPTQLVPGTPRDFRVRFEIPAAGPLTFAAEDNKVLWQVKVAFVVPNWPDWSEERPLVVAPRAKRA